jgi:mycothiol synthase
VTTPPWVTVPYRPGSEREIVALWNRCLVIDGVTDSAFQRKVLLDPNFHRDGARAVWSPIGELIGFCYAVARRVPMMGVDLEPDTGWITAFFVHPGWRRRGVGRRLLEDACGFLHERGAKEVWVSPYTPNYFLPGVDPDGYPEAAHLLGSLGFSVAEEPVAMARSLVGYRAPAEVDDLERRLAEQGIRVRAAAPELFVPLLDTIRSAFSEDWVGAAREGLRGAEPDALLVAVRGRDEVLGWCQVGAYGGAQTRFGPFGVLPTMRGSGIGQVLLHRCLERMRHKGFQHVFFLWADPATAAGRLYLRAGFEVTRRFQVFRRSLPA